MPIEMGLLNAEIKNSPVSGTILHEKANEYAQRHTNFFNW